MTYFAGQSANSYVNSGAEADLGSGWGIHLENGTITRLIADEIKEFCRQEDAWSRQREAESFDPIQYRFKRRRSTYPDAPTAFNRGPADKCVSDRVKAHIEALEPGKHLFFPLHLFNPGDEPWPTSYWMMVINPTNVRQCLIVEQSPYARWKQVEAGRYSRRVEVFYPPHKVYSPISNSRTESAAGLTLDRAMVGDGHLIAESLFRDKSILYFSDDFVARCRSDKVTGFKFAKIKTEERMVPPYGHSDGGGLVE